LLVLVLVLVLVFDRKELLSFLRSFPMKPQLLQL
jgi:hypothetical protein